MICPKVRSRSLMRIDYRLPSGSSSPQDSPASISLSRSSRTISEIKDKAAECQVLTGLPQPLPDPLHFSLSLRLSLQPVVTRWLATLRWPHLSILRLIDLFSKSKALQEHFLGSFLCEWSGKSDSLYRNPGSRVNGQPETRLAELGGGRGSIEDPLLGQELQSCPIPTIWLLLQPSDA